MNTADCKSCLYKKRVPVGAHCYMFKEEPNTKCRQYQRNVIPFKTLNRRTRKLERT